MDDNIPAVAYAMARLVKATADTAVKPPSVTRNNRELDTTNKSTCGSVRGWSKVRTSVSSDVSCSAMAASSSLVSTASVVEASVTPCPGRRMI